MQRAACARPMHIPQMATYKEMALDYLRQVVEATGDSASKLASRVGVSSTTFTRPLNDPEHKYAIKFTALRTLAEVTGIPMPAELSEARTTAAASATEVDLPIRFEVAASGFLARDELPQQPYGYRRVPSIAPYPEAEQWLERVVNDSMNRLLPPGSLIHVVSAIHINYLPQHDDIVVVERLRYGGALVERTVKQVALTPQGPELWPRSHNPQWSRPIQLIPDETSDYEVRIDAKVLRSYQFFD